MKIPRSQSAMRIVSIAKYQTPAETLPKNPYDLSIEELFAEYMKVIDRVEHPGMVKNAMILSLSPLSRRLRVMTRDHAKTGALITVPNFAEWTKATVDAVIVELKTMLGGTMPIRIGAGMVKGRDYEYIEARNDHGFRFVHLDPILTSGGSGDDIVKPSVRRYILSRGLGVKRQPRLVAMR